MSDPTNRRSFLTGRAFHHEVEKAGDQLADQIAGGQTAKAPSAGDTIRLTTRAMACDFCVVMQPGQSERIMQASAALDLIHQLEQQLTIYRDDSEVSRINQLALNHPIPIEPRLFGLLSLAQTMSRETGGALDITAGPLIALWRRRRQQDRIPNQSEIDRVLELVGPDRLSLIPSRKTLAFDRDGTRIDLGAIGKGYALDRAAELIQKSGQNTWLMHGGHSSILACGDHNQTGGWPIGIGNPLFADRRMGTLVLRNKAMSTSGSNIQFFRHQGKRYGHILDPRSGWPVQGALSVIAIADSAAAADALSTAFYVFGIEETANFCKNHGDVGAIVLPYPRGGRRIVPHVFNIADDHLFWDEQQVLIDPCKLEA